ncbi:unnamed protein product [Spirodela intermedia]|uniref:Uncharacterized protein n=1 Tax=Spirodela intermedia TaxID=51605 RepID=A0A7I8KWX1_SPIIN|nr:unnamed protein product [Spirodela intermedia]
MDGISLLAHQIQGFLSSHLPLSKTKQLHALIITSSLLDPSFALTKLLRLYGLNGALTCARSMFEEIPERSVYAWNAMIRANARRNDFDGAFSLFLQMLRTGAGPDSHTFACILRACAEMPHGRRAASTHGKLISCGLGTDPLACSSLITAYAKLGSVDLAGRVFRAVQEPDLVLWNSMLSAYAHCGYWFEGFELFSRMRSYGKAPDGYSMVGLLSCLRDPILIQIGWGSHGICVKGGLDLGAHVRSALVSMYSRCGCMASAWQMFGGMPQEPDLVQWSAMVTGFLQAGEYERSIWVFSEMTASLRQKPDAVLVASVLSACGSLTAIRLGKAIHCYVYRLGIESDVSVTCALMNMYLKCGFTHPGSRIFLTMPEKNITAFNIMISGLGSHGRGAEAMEIFEEMLSEGLKPDEATFSALLCACSSHAEFAIAAKALFVRMTEEFGVAARTEHYVYMVKILGMAGELKAAYELIKTMPTPEAGAWGALLWCCNVHGDLELAETVARELFVIQPEKGAYRVILSNMHAAEGNWAVVENLRGDMGEYVTEKTPGVSWIADGET